MIARIQKTMAKRAAGEKGFTLIELLVVVIIIGILAAIAIPAFLNQRKKAWGAAVVSDISNAVIAAESYAVDNNGSYVGTPVLDPIPEADGVSAATSWKLQGFNGTKGVNMTASVSANSYTLVARNTNLGIGTADPYWTYTSVDGKTVRTN